MHLKKNEGNASPAETLCHQCGASSKCEKAKVPGTCGASATGSGLFLPHGEYAAGHPGGRAAVCGAVFRSPGAPDTLETQESMMECVCEHSLRHHAERGRERANTSAGVCKRASRVQAFVACSGGLAPPRGAAQGPRWSACIQLGLTVAALALPGRPPGPQGAPCLPSHLARVP